MRRAGALALAILLAMPARAAAAASGCLAEARRLEDEVGRLRASSERLEAEARAIRATYDQLSDERDAMRDDGAETRGRLERETRALDRRDRAHAAAVQAFERARDEYRAAARAYAGRCAGR